MPENYDHYITKNIKALYKRRLFSPIVYLIIVIVLWHVFSLTDLLFPVHLTDDVPLESAYRNDAANMHTTLTDLKFTGYTRSNFAGTSGYYYYTIRNDECIIVLLSPSTCEEGLPSIDEVKLTGKKSKVLSESFHALFKKYGRRFKLDRKRYSGKVSGYYISEPDYNRTINTILFTVIFGTGIYAILCLVLYILFIFFPGTLAVLSGSRPVCNPKKLLEQAEEELATLPQLATEDMFITEHYFIETSIYGNAIIPIDQIIWIYKYSTLISFSGIISVFPIHCISAPTSICISVPEKYQI